MPLAPQQIRKLKARLSPRHIRTREAEGRTLSYLEGWHVIAEANRIFGFDGWDRELIDSACVYTKQQGERFNAAYAARIRIRVRAGEHMVTREGSGAGEASASSPGQAHELAMKAAETDATKRALMTFGNPFGLSLYGAAKQEPVQPTQFARDAGGKFKRHALHNAQAADRLDSRADRREDIDRPNGSVIAHGEPDTGQSDIPDSDGASNGIAETEARAAKAPGNAAPRNMTATKAYAIRSGALSSIVKATLAEHPADAGGTGQNQQTVSGQSPAQPVHPEVPAERLKIDKSVLALSEPARIRDQAHLKFVASQPCLICGRNRAQAHHLRFAQPKALGRKVSDEYTVPLCSMHHRLLHQTGNEIGWWEYQQIDPLATAAQLWRQSRAGNEGSEHEPAEVKPGANTQPPP